MGVALDPTTRKHVEREAQVLRAEFAGRASPETVQRYVDESLDQLSDVRVTDFVPVFVRRFVRERLRELYR